MTTPHQPPAEQTREILGLVILLAGVGGLVGCAFALNTLFGTAVLSLLAAAVGAYMTTGEV